MKSGKYLLTLLLVVTLFQQINAQCGKIFVEGIVFIMDWQSAILGTISLVVCISPLIYFLQAFFPRKRMLCWTQYQFGLLIYSKHNDVTSTFHAFHLFDLATQGAELTNTIRAQVRDIVVMVSISTTDCAPRHAARADFSTTIEFPLQGIKTTDTSASVSLIVIVACVG